LNFPGLQLGTPVTSDWLSNALDPDRFTWQLVDYPAWTYPMETSINVGVEMMAELIASTTTDFVLVGTSQGADVISNVYDELRTGALTAYRSRLRAGVTFGNPMRQAGHTFPAAPTPAARASTRTNSPRPKPRGGILRTRLILPPALVTTPPAAPQPVRSSTASGTT